MVTGDYIGLMKTILTEGTKYPEAESKPAVLKESAVPAAASWVNVRDAKSHLSALLDWVADGHEITITSDGKPKARLVPVIAEPSRKVFGGMGAFLSDQPIDQGPSGDQIIRDDRDARGW